jgi:hypothetical protein
MKAAAILMSLSLFGFGGPPLRDVRSVHMGDWLMVTTHDRFTGEIRCKAATHTVSLGRDAVTFRFLPTDDTSNAVYRLDLGAPHAVQAISRDMIAYGRPINLVSLDNPSAGEVVLPLKALMGVQRVDIRLDENARPKAFSLKGLDAVLAAYRNAGCPTPS